MIIKKIILAIILSFGVIAGSWYLHNQTAKNIVSGVVKSPLDNLKSNDNRTNILLLGMGGEGHEGGDLTDSILLVSLDMGTYLATIIPVPRDVWVPTLKAKINTAYHYGEERRAGGGLDLAKSAVSEILGIPVHYGVTLDFQGFIKAIDAVGGIDVVIDNTFDDYKYPIPGKETVEPESARYEHIHFEKGTMHMDGTTALKFARSRHALGDEGTDFARGARQAKIIASFKNKILSTDTLFNNQTLQALKNSVTSSYKTDISSLEQGSFIKLFFQISGKENIKNISITDQFTTPKSLRIYNGQWVLIPKTTLEEIHKYVETNLQKQ